jgi:molybdate transport repressor ModE-like protein
MASAIRIGDLAGLDVFVAAVRLGSISAAARECGISQPAATERLRTLERRIGIELLRRGPGGSVPTAAGQTVAEWAGEVTRSVELLAAGITALQAQTGERPLRIMASLTIAEYVMPTWLHAHRTGRGSAVELTVGNSQLVAAAVTAGDVELGFVETPRPVPGVRSSVVGGDQLAIVVAPDHEWVRRKRRVTPALLARTPMLSREAGSGTRDVYEAAIRRAGFTAPPPLGVMGSTTALKGAVAAGDGACVLSRLAIVDELAAGTLAEVAVQGLDLTREFRALWRPAAHEPGIARFVRLASATP